MDEEKSKSQKKRDADASQQLGLQLMALHASQLDLFPLSARMKQAIIEAKRLKSHGAIRRQSQFIGKLMRSEEVADIQQAFDQLQAEDAAQTAAFHELERWRARLISEGNDALTQFIELYRPSDVQHLRQLIKKAVDEQARSQSLGASKALFRYLRSCVL